MMDVTEPEAAEEPEAAGQAAIAVDIGGTNTRVALVWPSLIAGAGPTVVAVAPAFATEQDYAAQMARLAVAVAAALRLAERLRMAQPRGVGVALGGRIARDGGGVVVAPNLRD